MDAVAAGLGAKVDYRQPDAGGARIEDRIGPGDAGGKRIHQDVAIVAAMEIHLATNRGHAE